MLMFKQHSSIKMASNLHWPPFLFNFNSFAFHSLAAEDSLLWKEHKDSCNVSDKHTALRDRTAKPSISLEPAVDLILKALISFQTCYERTC